MQIGRSLGKKKFTNLRELATRCITKDGAYNKETICIINWLNNQFIFTLKPCRPVSETRWKCHTVGLKKEVKERGSHTVECTNLLIVVFMMQRVYTREKYVSDFALSIRNAYSFEDYFLLWPQCFILWPQKTTKTALLDFFPSFSTFLTILWIYHLGMYFVFADLMLLRYYIWKYVILKYPCFNQRTQTIARSI